MTPCHPTRPTVRHRGTRVQSANGLTWPARSADMSSVRPTSHDERSVLARTRSPAGRRRPSVANRPCNGVRGRHELGAPRWDDCRDCGAHCAAVSARTTAASQRSKRRSSRRSSYWSSSACIEFGLAFKDQLAMTSAVRAGARIASAEPRSATFATDAASQVATRGIGPRHEQRAGAVGLSGRRAAGTRSARAARSTRAPRTAWCSRGTASNLRADRRARGPDVSRTRARARRTASASTCRSGTRASPQADLQLARADSYTVMRFEPIPALPDGRLQVSRCRPRLTHRARRRAGTSRSSARSWRR